jgi:phosphatidate phosphatase APP1
MENENINEVEKTQIGDVICSSREVNPNFKMETFKKKVEQHIKCGYTKELAEWKVLGDFNRLFLKAFGTKPNKKQTDAEGYYI